MEFIQMMNLMSIPNEAEMLKCLIAFLIGLAMHVIRQMAVEQVSFKDYVMEHKNRTYLSMGSLIGVFMLLQTSYPSAPFIVYLMGGYCVDSLMNKAPLSLKKLENEDIKS